MSARSNTSQPFSNTEPASASTKKSGFHGISTINFQPNYALPPAGRIKNFGPRLREIYFLEILVPVRTRSFSHQESADLPGHDEHPQSTLTSLRTRHRCRKSGYDQTLDWVVGSRLRSRGYDWRFKVSADKDQYRRTLICMPN